jgi:hypothetical protein
MAITQAMCNSFKKELMTATHNFTTSTGNTFKLALFRATASIVGTFGYGTTNYSNMGADEVSSSGTSYTTTGLPLTNVTPTVATSTSSEVAFTDFADLTFSAVTLTTSGCLIYNSTAGGNAVAVFSFGGDKTATAGDLTIIFPTANASSAVIRLS